jgi:hypothetical protein
MIIKHHIAFAYRLSPSKKGKEVITAYKALRYYSG